MEKLPEYLDVPVKVRTTLEAGLMSADEAVYQVTVDLIQNWELAGITNFVGCFDPFRVKSCRKVWGGT